jgi:hypothetical protein
MQWKITSTIDRIEHPMKRPRRPPKSAMTGINQKKLF